MSCRNCNSNRVASVNAKCGDLFGVVVGGASYEGEVPYDIGIGGGDYIRFSYCLDCGTIQGAFPRPETSVEMEEQS